MSPLTKAFVLIVTVLSIALSAVVVAFVAKTEDYKTMYEDGETARQTAELQATKQTLAAAQLTALLQSEQLYANTLSSSVNNDLADAMAQIDTLQHNLEATAREAQNAESEADRWRTIVQESRGGNDMLVQELQATTQELHNMQIENTRLIEELDSQQARLENTDRQLAQNRDQIQELQLRLEQALANGGGNNQTPTPQTTVNVQGQVVQVERTNEGIVVVRVNVGSQDGLQTGTELSIFRGNLYLGKVRVVNVDLHESVAQAVSLQEVPQPNDDAVTF